MSAVDGPTGRHGGSSATASPGRWFGRGGGRHRSLLSSPASAQSSSLRLRRCLGRTARNRGTRNGHPSHLLLIHQSQLQGEFAIGGAQRPRRRSVQIGDAGIPTPAGCCSRQRHHNSATRRGIDICGREGRWYCRVRVRGHLLLVEPHCCPCGWRRHRRTPHQRVGQVPCIDIRPPIRRGLRGARHVGGTVRLIHVAAARDVLVRFMGQVGRHAAGSAGESCRCGRVENGVRGGRGWNVIRRRPSRHRRKISCRWRAG